MIKKIISIVLIIISLATILVSAQEIENYTYSGYNFSQGLDYYAYMYGYSGANVHSYGETESSTMIDSGDYVEALQGVQLAIPALMYHKVTDNPLEVTDYVVTGKMLEDDFAEMKARGYTPITVSDYYRMVKLSKNLITPSNYTEVAKFFRENPKPIIITFDDGYKGIYTHVLPLMKKYNFKVNFYICGELIDTKHPEYCTWEDIKALVDSGLADIGNHTYSLHAMSKNELAKMYSTNFEAAVADINKNRDVIAQHTGVHSTVFSFPYGQYDGLVLNMMKAYGYSAFVSTDYKINRVSDGRAALGRFNRSAFETTKQFFDVVEQKCK